MLRKVLKKISLVYTLQVLAVIFLFSFAGASAVKETKASATDAVLPLINKEKTELFHSYNMKDIVIKVLIE